MAIPKVVLFYAFRPLADPDALRLWQRDLCEGLGLRGRILLSRHGINAARKSSGPRWRIGRGMRRRRSPSADPRNVSTVSNGGQSGSSQAISSTISSSHHASPRI